MDDKEYLLKSYGEMYNPECGPWNLSLISKWYEYEITKFFEENFELASALCISNIGIGAGFWDRYLAYKMPKDCSLVSIDKDYECCKQLRLFLDNEENPKKVEIINEDVLDLTKKIEFDLITMIGSTIQESSSYAIIITEVLGMLKSGGSLFYNSLNPLETKDDLIKVINSNQYTVDNYQILSNHGRKLIFAKIIRNNNQI